MVEVNIAKDGKHGEVRKIFNVALRNHFLLYCHKKANVDFFELFTLSKHCFTYSKSDITDI